MNAMILLVWLAAADAPVVKPAPAHLHPAPAATIVHGSCNNCCDSGGHHLFGKLRGLFHRSCDDGCKTAGCGGHAQFHQRHHNSGCNEGGHKLAGFLHRWRHHDCGEPCCNEGYGHKLRERFHSIFRKHDDDCCPPGAPVGVIQSYPPSTAPGKGATPGTAPPLGPTEKLKTPQKKLPDTEKSSEPQKKSSLTPQSPASLTLEPPGR